MGSPHHRSLRNHHPPAGRIAVIQKGAFMRMLSSWKLTGYPTSSWTPTQRGIGTGTGIGAEINVANISVATEAVDDVHTSWGYSWMLLRIW